MTETLTIAQLANNYSIQPHEVIASLDLPRGTTDDTEVNADFANEVLTLMADHAADQN